MFLEKKATNESSSKQAVSEENGIVYGNTVNSKALLKRAFLFLEDGEFDRADRYLEKVLFIIQEAVFCCMKKCLLENIRKFVFMFSF